MTYKTLAKPFGGLAICALSLLMVCGCLVPVVPAHAVTAAEMAAEADAALSQLHAMQDSLDQASDNYFIALHDYQQAVSEREAIEANIADINDQIETIQARLGHRARDMYRNGSSSMIDLLLGATSFNEFTQNWELLNRVNETDAELSVKNKELRTRLAEEKEKLLEQEKILEERSVTAGEAFQVAQTLYEEMQATYEALSAEAQALYAAEQAAAYNYGGIQNEDGTVTDYATGQVYASASEYVAATGNAVVDRALAMQGAGYNYGSSGWDGMFDCSGLVGYALTGSYNRIGSTADFINWPVVTDPQPGDVCVIHNGDSQHTGIYLGNGEMVHAAGDDVGVIVSSVQNGMIYVRYPY